MITLHNVTDIRTGKFHSVVKIKERLARWFVHHEPTTETPAEE